MAYEILDNRDKEELENTKANLEIKKISFGFGYGADLKDGMHVYELVDITTGTFGAAGEIELYFAGGAMIMGGPFEEERHKFSIGRKYCIEAQYEEVYEMVIPKAIYDIIDLQDKANIEDIGSRVLLDTTLTEEQAGASSVLLEIPNWQLFKKAKQWNFFLSHPYSGAYATGAINYRADIRDKNSVSYCFPIGFESNNAYSADYNIATWHTVTFNLCFDDGLGEIMTIQNKPTCWSRVSAYNTLNNARVTNSSRGINAIMSEGYPPYLEVKNSSNFIFEAGTRIYLEVQL